MIHIILIKIHFFRPLQVLYSELLSALQKRLTSILSSKGFKLKINRDGYYLFTIDSRREQIDQIILDSISIIEENLINEDEWLSGYTLIIEQTSKQKQIEDVFFSLKELSLMAFSENKIWVSESLKSQKSQEWHLVGNEPLVVLDRFLIKAQQVHNNSSQLTQHVIFARLNDLLLKKKKVRGPTLLVCDDFEALKIHVLNILKDQEYIFYLPQPKFYEEPFAHFVGALYEVLQKTGILDDHFSSVNWFDDAKHILNNYLDEQGSNIVFYLVFEEFSEWGEEFKRFWENFLKGIARHARPIFLERKQPITRGLGEPLILDQDNLGTIWGQEGLKGKVTTLDPFQKRILFLCLITPRTTYLKTLIDFLIQKGEDKGIVEDKINLLLNQALLVQNRNQLIPVKMSESTLQNLIFESQQELSHSWLSYVFLKNSDLPLTRKIELLMKAGDAGRLLFHLNQYFHTLLYRQSPSFNLILNNSELDKFFQSHPQEALAWKVSKLTAQLRFLLDVEDQSKIVLPTLEEIEARLESENKVENGDWLCQTSRLLHAHGNLDEAFSRIRQAYALSQKEKDGTTEIFSAIEIGHILLKKKKHDEAAEYFSIAWRESEKMSIPLLEVHSAILTGVAKFIIGSLRSCEASWRKAQELSQNYYLHELFEVSSFLLGRHSFELGQYVRAIKHFENALGVFGEVAYAWASRCLTYSGQSDQAVKKLEKKSATLESEFFLSEALYFSGRQDEAINLAKRWQGENLPTVRWNGIRWNTSTGFSCLEDLCLESEKEQTVLSRLSTAFKDFLILWYESPDHEESIQRFEKVCSDKNLYLKDPNTHLYFLWFSLVLGKGQLEKNARWSTLMGRGLKELQTRGSKVDDRDERVTYLNTPWWNTMLLNEARKNKLI